MSIRKYLRENRIEFEIGTHVPHYTAQEIAAAEHVPGRMLAKVVIVKADGRFVMTVVPAPRMLDTEKLKLVLGTQEVRLADESEMKELFPDCEVGAEPPFGNLYDMETLIDHELATQNEIVFQSGTHRETIHMRYADYDGLVRPKVADITFPAEAHAR